LHSKLDPTESVTVSDTPSVVNTESGARGEVVTEKEITEIPLDGRNFTDLAYLTGGVIPRGDGGDGSFAVNGGRADNFGFYVDGVNNTQRRNTGAVINPPLEGVQEFKVITSGFSAEYGRYAGGMMSVVTKGGTNKLHGSLYEFLRNDAFDATSYIDVAKSKLRRNQFGA
jgi:outer membrane receptor for ferrienterochelin and colicin